METFSYASPLDTVIPGIGSPLFALSVRQPWAWLIFHAGKDVENRRWSTRFRGRVLIHAAKSMTRMEYESARMYCVTRVPTDIEIPAMSALPLGGIIGSVEITGCVAYAPTSPWFTGPFGFMLKNPSPLPFKACRGSLGFWKPDQSLLTLPL